MVKELSADLARLIADESTRAGVTEGVMTEYLVRAGSALTELIANGYFDIADSPVIADSPRLQAFSEAFRRVHGDGARLQANAAGIPDLVIDEDSGPNGSEATS